MLLKDAKILIIDLAEGDRSLSPQGSKRRRSGEGVLAKP